MSVPVIVVGSGIVGAAVAVAAMAEWRALPAAMPDLPVSFAGSLVWDIDAQAMRDFVAEPAGQGHALRPIPR